MDRLVFAIARIVDGFLVLSSNAIAQPKQTNDGDRRLNFVLFLVDDLGWMDIGAFGSSFYETPHDE